MTKPTVTIYSRPGCHLCENARKKILSAAPSGSFDLEVINIDEHPDLAEKHRYDIPVVFINGIKVFKHMVDPREFKRKLDRLSGSRR
jgi:glutaredoxin